MAQRKVMKQRIRINGAKLYRLALERMSLFNPRAAEELRKLSAEALHK